MTIKETGNVNYYLFYQSILAVAVLVGAVALKAEPTSVDVDEVSYSPYVDVDYPENVYWGDTHLHTSLSVDANLSGNTKLGPEEAYRFARGEVITAHNGMKVRLHRPLDFLVVADHAFNLGLAANIRASDPVLLKTEAGRRLHARFLKIQANPSKSERASHHFELYDEMVRKEFVIDHAYREDVWSRVTANADDYNEAGKFTAFIGYEWTSWGSKWDPNSDPYSTQVLGGLHRVVIFKDAANKVDQIQPFSLINSANPEDLWRFMDGYQEKTGGEVLAIPHNSNLSKGEMFAPFGFDGRPLSKAYAKTRSRWEPLMEVAQIKGVSETHPILSPSDEFADYEIWQRNSGAGDLAALKKSEYARSALKSGLEQKARLGVNPFKFGMIGSTDSHTSLSTADENNFWGKMTHQEPNSNRLLGVAWEDIMNSGFSVAGYAAIWATENTREALFAAMKRKEVYATTGPRIEVRFFGGWDYHQEDALRPDFARIGYSKGVPMGGDLTDAPKGKVPSFLIRAVKDPDGANLDRVQVIKGWRSADGVLHEKIYDIALSDGRKVRWNGKVKPVGNTVDVENAAYTNRIGDPELAVVWTDPDFKKDELAFYYLRILEIPTPRWTAYDAKFFKIKDIPDEVPMVTQERAYSSPIWYSPKTLSTQGENDG